MEANEHLTKLLEQNVWLIEDIDQISELKSANKLDLQKYILVVHCWQGKVQVSVKDEQYVLTNNHLLLCSASFLIDNFMRTPECKCGVLCIKADYFAQLLNSNFHLEPHWWEKFTLMQRYPIVEMSEYDKQLLSAYYTLFAKFTHGEMTPFRQKMLQRLTELIYLELSNYYENKVEEALPLTYVTAKRSQSDILFRKFIDMLRVYPICEREVKWYADKLCVTPKYLSSVCRTKSGKTAMQWINARLTEQLRHALVDTETPIKEIVYEFHFPSRSFFGKYVKHVLGMSPKQYRISAQSKIYESKE